MAEHNVGDLLMTMGNTILCMIYKKRYGHSARIIYDIQSVEDGEIYYGFSEDGIENGKAQLRMILQKGDNARA